MAVIKYIWQNFERWISAFLITLLTVMLFIEVLFRYLFYQSIGWINEFSGFIFVWFLYLSVSYITGRNSHIRVQILDLLIPKRYIQYVDIAMNFLWLAFNVLITYYGVQLVLSVVRYPFKTPILDISMAYPYAIIPLAFGLISIRLATIIYKDIMGISNVSQS